MVNTYPLVFYITLISRYSKAGQKKKSQHQFRLLDFERRQRTSEPNAKKTMLPRAQTVSKHYCNQNLNLILEYTCFCDYKLSRYTVRTAFVTRTQTTIISFPPSPL